MSRPSPLSRPGPRLQSGTVGPAPDLGDLGDVVIIGTPDPGDVLVWDPDVGAWVPGDAGSGSNVYDDAWFDVTDPAYGATGDGSTDDTTAIQDAIDACVAAGGGVVYFPPGIYVIGGALQDTGGFNGQLLLPDVDHSDPHVVIEFRGALRPGFHPVYGTDILADTAHSILKSTLTGASGTAACISGGNDLGTLPGGGNNLEVVLRDLVCIGPENPTFTFWNLSSCQGGDVRGVQISTVGAFAGTPTQPTHSNAYCIKLPQRYFANYVGVELAAGGFYAGVLGGELCVYEMLILGPTEVGIVPTETDYPSIVYHLQATSVARVIVPSGPTWMDVLLYVRETPTSGWSETDYDLDDPSDYLSGYIRYLCATSGGSPDAFNVNGGANSSQQEIGAAWGSGAAVADLDDLGDVVISSATTDDDLRFNGTNWVNDPRKWEAVTDGEDVFVWEGDDLVHEWST